jgi:hypothetical protein
MDPPSSQLVERIGAACGYHAEFSGIGMNGKTAGSPQMAVFTR